MTIKIENITPEMRDNYIIKPLVKKVAIDFKERAEYPPLLDKNGNPVIIQGMADIKPKIAYTEHNFVRKISRNEYAYA